MLGVMVMQSKRVINEKQKQQLNRNGVATLLLLIFVGFSLPCMVGSAVAAPAGTRALESVTFSSLPNDQLQLQLQFNGPAPEPSVFHTDSPARIALDFSAVSSAVKRKSIPITIGVTRGVHVVEASGRTRVVVDLLKTVPFDAVVDGNTVLVTLQNEGGATAFQPAPKKVFQPKSDDMVNVLPRQTIEKIDFRRGKGGVGRVLIYLSNPNTVVDMQDKAGKVTLDFVNTSLPPSLAKVLDVMDFATPVRSIRTVEVGNRVKMTVIPSTREYDYLSFQSEGLLTLEFRPLSKAEKLAQQKKKFKYVGKKLSLNFQNIEVRSVLQILADFTDLNIIASDAVGGRVTLRLNDVPWDHALSLILKSKGLGKKQTGNVILVAPLAKIRQMEKEELQANLVRRKLEPLRTEIIQLNYANAQDIRAVLMGVQATEDPPAEYGPAPEYTTNFAESTIQQPSASLTQESILSKRGVVNIDPRTNILIVKDTAQNIEAIRELVLELDKPVRQVLIESRVVIARNNFARQLGIRFVADKQNVTDSGGYNLIGATNGTQPLELDVSAAEVVATGLGGAFGASIFKAGDYLLNLEISALQAEDEGEVISNPRLVTSDQTTAKIEQGLEIPFQTSSGNFGTQTQFKKAVLSLEVTPHITPDDHVEMDLDIKKDAPEAAAGGLIAINTRSIQTTVMVENGGTVVLGGIFEGTRETSSAKLPFLGEIPLLGWLFTPEIGKNDTKSELLIFITPKILQESLSIGG